MNRLAALSSIQDKPDVSVLVIGGGINGIGVFRDLALQGVDVLLVERADFCSGASAASSHMIHGGLRYLENGEFRLVREALTERNRLLRNAPHQVRPLSTVVPIFKYFSGLLNAPLKFLGLLDRPAERGAVVIKLGLMLYDAFTRQDRALPAHKFRPKSASLEQFPQLSPDIVRTAEYFDAAVASPERLCLDLLADAQAAGPHARAANYLRVVGAEGTYVTLHDLETGAQITVRPRIVVNAAGPWIDMSNRAMGQPSRWIGGTKGSHVVLDHPGLRKAVGESELYFENRDGRMVLIYPFQHLVMVGTSDIPIEDPDTARCTPDEVDYFLDMLRRIFPGLQVEAAQIVFRFSGVRPLPTEDRATSGQISRDHAIRTREAGDGIYFPILSLVGGKWTTFRAFAEQTADVVLERLAVPRKISTSSLPIGGGSGYPRSAGPRTTWLELAHQETGLPQHRLEPLLGRYGTRALEAAAYIDRGPDQPLAHHPEYSRREIEWLVSEEMAVHLDDLLLRRTKLAMLGELSVELMEELASLQGGILGWDEPARRQEIERTLNILADKHQVTL